MEIFRKLNREQDLTVILVTHESEVANYADRVVTFRDGVVVSDTKVSQQQPGASGAEQRAQTIDLDEESASESSNEFLAFASMTMRAASFALRRTISRFATGRWQPDVHLQKTNSAAPQPSVCSVRPW